MAARRKDSSVKVAVEKILNKKGLNYSDWKSEVINKRKLEVMSDKDKEWTERTLQEASLDLIMEEINKEMKNNNHESSSVKPFEKQN